MSERQRVTAKVEPKHRKDFEPGSDNPVPKRGTGAWEPGEEEREVARTEGAHMIVEHQS